MESLSQPSNRRLSVPPWYMESLRKSSRKSQMVPIRLREEYTRLREFQYSSFVHESVQLFKEYMKEIQLNAILDFKQKFALMVRIVEIPQVLEFILENSSLFPGAHQQVQERTSSGLTPLDPLRQLDLIWKGICVHLNESLRDGRGINVKNFGALCFEAGVNQGNSSVSLRPCFIPSKDLEPMIQPRKAQLEKTVEGSIYQQGIRMSYLNPAPIAAGCYFSTDFVRRAVDVIFRAIHDLIFRGYNLNISIPCVADIRITNKKLSCVFDKGFVEHSKTIACAWPVKSVNNAISVFDIPKTTTDGDTVVSPVHVFKTRTSQSKLPELQKPDISSLKDMKQRIKILDDSSRDLFNLVPT